MSRLLENTRRFAGSFAVKLIGMLLVVLGALLLLSLHLNSQTRRDVHAAFYRRSHQLVQRLQRLERTLRATVSLKRETYSAAVRQMARSPALTYAMLSGDSDSVYQALNQLMARNFGVRHLEVRDDRERLVAQCGQAEREGSDSLLFVVERLRVGDGWLVVRFAIPRQLRAIKRAIGDELKWEEFQRAFDDVLVKFEYTGWFTGRFAVGMLVVLVIALFFARSLTRRLARLAGATRQVAAGDLDVLVNTRSRDEIGQLARAFNHMVDELRRSQAQIAYLQKISAWQEIARRLAHEIKNPLTPILLATQQVREKYPGDDGEYRRLLEESTEIVQEEIGELRRLVEEFSAFAKLPQVEAKQTDIESLFADCRRGLGELEAKVDVSWETPAEALGVQVDVGLFKRVIYNLIENAYHAAAAADARPVVTVRALASRTARTVRLEVIDNGPGVPDELRERIFDPYFTTKDDGQGLGLAIVKKIVLEHGGTIEAGAAKPTGTRFVVTLPRG